MNGNEVIDLKRLYLVIRRHQKLAGIILGAFVGLAFLYVLFATPQYQATAQLLVDKSVTQTVSEISAVKRTGFEMQSLESELEIIKSYNVAKAAFEILKAKGYFKDLPQEEEEIQAAIRDISSNLEVVRIADTYVFSISYSSEDPQKSADFANAIAQAYIQGQISMMSEISTRTITWLQSKINDINNQAASVRKKLVDYRAAYNKSQRARVNQTDAAEPAAETAGEESEQSVLDNPPAEEPAVPAASEALPTAPSPDIGIRELKVLEQEIQTYDTLYDFYLEKLKTIGVQETFPLTETRVITEALPPTGKSHPRILLILAAALVFGAGAGLVAALLLDSLDSTLRRAGQVQRELGFPFLGFLPERQNSRISSATFLSKSGASYTFMLPNSSVAEPSSLYSEVTRIIVNAAEEKKVIGILSVDAADAKRFTASNLSAFLALSSPCLLINADLRTNGTVKASGIPGFNDQLTGKTSASDGILRQKDGNLALLESFSSDLNDTLPYMTASRVKSMMKSLREQFENIVVIMPDLQMSAEVYSFSESVDGFIVVAEWGRTQPNNLNFYLRQNNIDPAKVLGVVLENADMDKMDKFYGHKKPKS